MENSRTLYNNNNGIMKTAEWKQNIKKLELLLFL